jgi:FKBP-type peptidyl-prolyl cis-trans isomerase FkpA
MDRSRKIAVVVSVLALAGLAAHAQVQPASGSASAAVQPAGPGPAKAADGSETWPSGLVFRTIKEGTGASPSPTDTVKVHYRGTFPDGKEFDSSYTRGQPAEFPLNRVIPCWTEGVQKLKVGGKAKLICPPAIAYGAKGAGGVIPPNATLHFDVELIGIAGR